MEWVQVITIVLVVLLGIIYNNKRIDDLRVDMNKRIDDLREDMNRRLDRIEGKIEKIESLLMSFLKEKARL
jgi:hypothetical protein